ncbi:PREDICTED: uncharacterized protein LOC106743051 [Dinoponera quadriceps]|uniref:Gustatory receptor n=1 Tax=Dinoponera quadriceps TaxID=609295 RepID=A0A6P3X2E2_DINQU|nr:PREDICTED: uncharacterized protein LOC106743051 [Dinoponera quadriceps]
MVKSIRVVLSPLLIISYVCGLRIVEFPMGYPRPWLSYLYHLLLWPTYCFLMTDIWIFYIPHHWLFYNAFVALNILMALLTLFIRLYYDKKFRNCLRKLAIVDETLEELGITTNYQKLNVKMAKYIGLKFDQVNEQLQRLADGEFTDRERRIKRIWENTVMRSHQRKFSNASSSEFMAWIVTHLHLELCKISHEINSIFEIEIILKMACYFFFIAVNIRELFYMFYKNYAIDREWFSIGTVTLWLLVYTYRLLIINYSCDIVSNKANATKDFISKVMYSTHNAEIRELIVQLLLQIIRAPLKFCGVGCFQLGFKFFHKSFRRGPIVPKIDNKAPYFDASVYLRPLELEQYMIRVRKIDKENLKLLRKMNEIHRMGGKVDCWVPDIEYKSKFVYQDRVNKEIMAENRKMLKKIREATTEYPKYKSLENWKNLRRLTEHGSRFFSPIKKQPIELDVGKQLASQNRTRCFFDVGLKEEDHNFGRIVFELYNDIVPRTCDNFAAFCRGDNELSYKRTPFHRIVVGYWCQGGDVTKFNGTGGTSIYGDSFDNENFELRHEGPGFLSMCVADGGRNDSKFNLTFKRLETVDRHNVVFGRVIDGIANVSKIEEFGTKTGKPIKSVIVLNCGVLPARRTHEKPSKPQI